MNRSRAVQTSDILTGLGYSDRAFLCVCIALFEDTTLSKRLEQWFGRTKDWVLSARFAEWKETADSVQATADRWKRSSFDDDALRLVLWIYLREAAGCKPRLALSRRSACTAADDLAAAIVHFVSPPEDLFDKALAAGRELLGRQAKETSTPASLADVALTTVESLVKAALADGSGVSDQQKAELLAALRVALENLDPASREKLLESISADQLNDAALTKILALGGGLASLSAAVGVSGFAAYILAAQASAFIPLVTGPMLVSLLSVLSNPITVLVGATVGTAWIASSANARVSKEVAVRVASLLALQGLIRAGDDCTAALPAFASSARIEPFSRLTNEPVDRYRREWERLSSAVTHPRGSLDDEVRCLMSRPISGVSTATLRLHRLLFGKDDKPVDTAVLATMTIGDVLYSAAMIDSRVVEAADFSRAELIEGRINFAAYADQVVRMDPIARAGAESNLEGYVAEQVVAAQLVAQGHQVSFPETSNQAGWDLMVDGQPFQVKCYKDSAGLSEHFERYPDVPVLANSELAEAVPEEYAGKVFFVEGYSQEAVDEITSTSLEAGADMLHPDVPVFAVAVCAVRNLARFHSGEVTGAQAVEQILVDGTTRAGLAVAGNFVGGGVGLLVFGPAGALVFGGVLPVLSQAQSGRVKLWLNDVVQSDGYRAWREDTDKSLQRLVEKLTSAMLTKQALLANKRTGLPSGLAADYVRDRVDDDIVNLQELQADLAFVSDQDREVESRVHEVIRWTAGSTIHPAAYQDSLKDVVACLKRRPSVGDRVVELGERGTAVAKEIYHGVKGWWQSRSK